MKTQTLTEQIKKTAEQMTADRDAYLYRAESPEEMDEAIYSMATSMAQLLKALGYQRISDIWEGMEAEAIARFIPEASTLHHADF